MDSDTEDDYGRISDVRRNLREIANSRSGTNVAKAIIAYEETPSLPTLVLLLEEVSKNTDFSTDLRLSLSYYMDEFLRQVTNPMVSCHAIFATTGRVLQYCSKIYADRVELVYQAVEQQIEALLIAEPKKVENSDNNGNVRDAKVQEKRQKRRSKKLIQAQFNPYAFRMKVKNPTSVSAEQRFSHDDFEPIVNVNYTIEYMYQDHTPAKLWENEPMIEPDNPNEQDEKKNYKLYTYHPEHRYNTLLPDIPFERLNMIKEYVNTNQLDVSEILNENMSNREYLYQYIALENQMLASRYASKTGQKRSLEAGEDVQAKRGRVDEVEMTAESVQKRLLEDAEESPSKRRHTEQEEQQDSQIKTEAILTQTSVDSLLSDPLKDLTIGDTTQVTLDDSEMGEPVLSSTLVNNESHLNLPADKEGTTIDLNQIDSGLGMDDLTETAAVLIKKGSAVESFDDEGVVLPDLIDGQRLQSLSPKVMVRDIFPGVPDKANLSIRLDSEILALSGIHETLEEIVAVPRQVRYSIKLNILQIPQKKLRRNCIFKLPKEFELFKEARLPSKRVAEPRVPANPRNAAQLAATTADDQCELEFDFEQNFLGFRRTTFDSGFDYDEPRAESAPVDENIIVDVVTEEATAAANATENEEIQPVRDTNATEANETLTELPAAALDTSIMNQSELNDALLSVDEDEVVLVRGVDNQIDLTHMEVDASPPELDATTLEEQANEASCLISKNTTNIDEETNARIIDWHRRLAPTLEAAHERQNFSIQDLNDEIIRKCQQKNGEATLADVLEDKDPTKLCCYMLSSLLLTNQGNVKLNIDNRDKSKPIEMHQFRMQLISTERKQLNPEDDIGNMRSSTKPGAAKTTQPTPSINHKRVKSGYEPVDELVQPVNAKTVRLIKPVPKAFSRADDADSGISSLPASLASGT